MGYVIRLCMGLGWHKLPSHGSGNANALSEQDCREMKSIERAWLVLFVHDQSYAPYISQCYIEEITNGKLGRVCLRANHR